MKTIWIATNNDQKIKEFEYHLKNFTIKSLKDYDTNLDIPETGDTFEQNALIKAQYLAKRVEGIVIADDSGLCVSILDGFPGIHSKRWFGQKITSWDEVNHKLIEMIDKKANSDDQRKAYFQCSLALVDTKNNISKVFSAQFAGKIGYEPIGDNGFAYDRIFIPDGYDSTVAQMSFEQKQQLSHRFKALEMLKNFLKDYE
ncbi:dITP/XTP pyrophosphatase [Spiroplasma helicoides]|uniref:dITP/XTP pyrophosphatase n=1 Tax=Spiroplasma helicoides TaxID=216938 RepID=A0A1B3SK70_9MOLU|nr:RdgB/HAM1 family non-canonical purine NTP pyrophosphatase [Spiroplasma helicoides]AOG60332.1 dITP/XTP pyrophosphatase [Spiroplasma helicoides]